MNQTHLHWSVVIMVKLDDWTLILAIFVCDFLEIWTVGS